MGAHSQSRGMCECRGMSPSKAFPRGGAKRTFAVETTASEASSGSQVTGAREERNRGLLAGCLLPGGRKGPHCRPFFFLKLVKLADILLIRHWIQRVRGAPLCRLPMAGPLFFFFQNNLYLFICFWLHWVFVAVRAFL